MAELARLGTKVTVFCADSGHHFFGRSGADSHGEQWGTSAIGMRLIRIRTLKYHKQRSLRRILSWLDFEIRLLMLSKSRLPKPDVIVASSLSLLTVLSGLMLSIRYRCKLVFEVRDIWPLTLVEEGGFSPWSPVIVLLSWIEWFGYRSADVIVGTMPNLAEHVRAVVGASPPVHCVPMGYDEQSLRVEIEAGLSNDRFGIPAGKFVVGYAGSMGVSNALETLFACAAELSHDSRIQFVLMGEGDLRGRYQSRFGHLSNVTFLQTVPRGDVPAVLSGCDVLYFATQASRVWKFGQSLNKLVDYMLASKPIVGSFTGYLSMVNEAQCGSVVPAEDVEALRAELLRFVELSADARDRLGRRGRAWVLANRSYRVLALQYRSILEGLGSPASDSRRTLTSPEDR